MVTVSSCLKCGESEIKGIMVNVTLTKSDFCKECRHDHETKRSVFFCSPECFLAYMKEGDQQEMRQTIQDLKDGVHPWQRRLPIQP